MRSGERWEVPADYYPPMLQKAVIVSASRNKAAAKAFLEFVRSEEGRNILAKYGFTSPEAAKR